MVNREVSRVIVCRGALATERRLFEELAQLVPTSPDDLKLPVRIIVPSRSLRLHLLRRLVEDRGAVAGVAVQTLGGIVHEITERSGYRAPGGVAGFEVLVRRLARGEEALAAELEALSDGYDVVLGAIRDLLDAGFGPDHEEAVLERLGELAPMVPLPDRRRAAALVRVAARAVEAAEITGARPQAAAYQRATESLSENGRAALPSRCVVIHGFADLTGVAADLVSAVVRIVGGVVLLDRVPDPSEPSSDDQGNVFLNRFEVRLGGLEEETDRAVAVSPVLRLVEAPDPEAEARWAAESVREVINSGIDPESIGIVSRRLDGFGPALRRQLRRLGVPFSGVGARVPGGLLRRKSRRFADLLRRGSGTELDLWYEVAEGLGGGVGLLLGLRVLALTRLRDLAGLQGDDRRVVRGVPLPLSNGVGSNEDGELTRPRLGRLSRSNVAAAADGARAVLEVLEGWPSPAVAAVHRVRAEGLLRALGWDLGEGHGATVLESIDDLASEFPRGLELDRTEWTSVLIKRLEGLGEVSIGGQGGGVQLLTVMEARARTFGHLVVCGLDRGVFPRQGVDDPLLPDLVRARLALDVLPEMPVKARSADEERYLFGQLVSAAPTVELSWHLRADGRRMAPSPFVERLKTADGSMTPERAPSLWAVDQPRVGPRPAYEHAVLTAVSGADVALGSRLGRAMVEGRETAVPKDWSVPTDRLAEARIEVVDAVEPGDTAPKVGPWSGFVASAVEPGDRLWVTYLEAVATCPWRAFLGRRLEVRPLPDPHLGLPDPNHRLVGEVVHRVLERIVTGSLVGVRLPLSEALDHESSMVPWPSVERLEALLAEVTNRVVFDEGLSGFDLSRLLAARVRPVLSVAMELDWGDSGELEGVLAAEVEGGFLSETTGRTIAFRADRLDGGPMATDYKTGKLMSGAQRPDTRKKHLLAKVKTGRLLQAVAYALATPSNEGSGRYVYLRPDIGVAPPEARIVEASAEDSALTDAFNEAAEAIDACLTAGLVFPRVEEPNRKKAAHCDTCQVAEACRRDDSVFRRRLIELMETEDDSADETLVAARRLWWLGVERKAKK